MLFVCRWVLGITIVTAVAAAVLTALGKVCRRPSFLHAFWVVVLLKFVTPPLFTLPLPLLPDETVESVEAQRSPFAPGTGFGSASFPQAGATPQLRSKSAPVFLHCVFAAWLGGTFIYFFVAAKRYLAFRRLVGFAKSAPPSVTEKVRVLCRRLGLSQCPRVSFLPCRIPPMVWAGPFRTEILLPAALWRTLSPAEQKAVLCHELIHIKRRDHLTRFLGVLVTGFYWWNPVAWYAQRVCAELEDLSCDAAVAELFPDCRRPLADGLIFTADFLAGELPIIPPVPCTLRNLKTLRRRISMLQKGCGRTPFSARLINALFALLLIPFAPVLGGDKEKPAEGKAKVKKTALKVKVAQTGKDDKRGVKVRASAGAKVRVVVGKNGNRQEKKSNGEGKASSSPANKVILRVGSLKSRVSSSGKKRTGGGSIIYGPAIVIGVGGGAKVLKKPNSVKLKRDDGGKVKAGPGRVIRLKLKPADPSKGTVKILRATRDSKVSVKVELNRKNNSSGDNRHSGGKGSSGKSKKVSRSAKVKHSKACSKVVTATSSVKVKCKPPRKK